MMAPTAYRVLMRADKKAGDVTAVFCDLPANPGHFVVYAHIGQHSEGVRDWYLNDTRPAQPDEYASLKQELEQIYSAPLRVMRCMPSKRGIAFLPIENPED